MIYHRLASEWPSANRSRRSNHPGTSRVSFWLLVAGSLIIPGTIVGQSRVGATRVELETTRDLARSHSLKISSQELMEIERRLRDGDFSIGDQITVQVIGEPSLDSTYTVTPGPTLLLRDIPPMSLAGILRSELDMRLTEFLAAYVRDPEVRTTTLMRVGMLGDIGSPGFYHLSPNLTLSDAIMSAGGPNPSADMGKVVIRRGQQEIYNSKEVTEAITKGTTLDRMNLHGGDAVSVGTDTGDFFSKTGRVILVAGALAASIISISVLLK